MKKLIAALLLCALVLSGCAQSGPAATRGTITFTDIANLQYEVRKSGHGS